ncbi:NitT/TauT family transport system permease protein [Actinocorallia herbida]|uniref:NitT/TauT family transport system permease protein n=1 Tax=Actinocorallia herbida TaxID=58109 RepID=A0A3N1D2R5_9ACTN|nr:ABC transporter permease [Actinocorallia herbida]ROO87827.1 NitT/TauT family transport system permease protein [Actinocorallia herbida]
MTTALRQHRTPLPRRRPARPLPALLTLGAPVPPRAVWLLRAASVLVPFTLWLLVSEAGWVQAEFLPTPSATWSAGWEMAKSGQLADDAWASSSRILWGFGIATLISVPLGILMGAYRSAHAALEPVIGILRYLPASAFIPLLVIWLGIGESSKIALLVIGVVFFNTLMTADVVKVVPRDLRQVSATLGARQNEILRRVIVPYALPGILDALRVNFAVAWNLVVVAELIAAESGLGYRIARAGRFLQSDKIFAVLIVIGMIGLAIDVLLRLLRDRIGRWQP